VSHSHLALVGLMGSGKSTVGRLVAAALGLPLVDVDDAIQARTGRGVAELWREGGEAAYRPLERAVVLDALDPAHPSVLAAPGGVIVDDAAVAALAAPHVGVVYLRADPAVLAERVRADPQPRPLLGSDPTRVLADQHAARDHRYEAIAHLVVPIDALDPARAAEWILAAGVVDAAPAPPVPPGDA
jgi:shikimate kinase